MKRLALLVRLRDMDVLKGKLIKATAKESSLGASRTIYLLSELDTGQIFEIKFDDDRQSEALHSGQIIKVLGRNEGGIMKVDLVECTNNVVPFPGPAGIFGSRVA